MQHNFPQELEFSRDYCLFLNNSITSLWASSQKNKIFNHKIEFINSTKKKELMKIFDSGDSLLFRQWFYDNKKLGDLYFITVKSVLRGLIWDFHNYVFEALELIAKKKYNIAYSLLRKPFKENLFLIEWIAVDSIDFMFRYNFLDSKEYTPLEYFGKKEKMLEIITKALSEIKYSYFFDAEFIYELRFDKSKFYSFDQLWNLSSHIY